MLLDYHPNLRLQFDEELKLLRARYVRPELLGDGLRPSMLALLRAMQHTQAQLLLLDTTNMLDIGVYDQIWLGLHWVPDAIKLPLTRVVFCFHPRKVHNQLAVESLIKLTQHLIRFDIQFFNEPNDGLAWLTDSSPRRAGLLAEWQAAPELTELLSDSPVLH